jgi:hypothetical protein
MKSNWPMYIFPLRPGGDGNSFLVINNLADVSPTAQIIPANGLKTEFIAAFFLQVLKRIGG